MLNLDLEQEKNWESLLLFSIVLLTFLEGEATSNNQWCYATARAFGVPLIDIWNGLNNSNFLKKIKLRVFGFFKFLCLKWAISYLYTIRTLCKKWKKHRTSFADIYTSGVRRGGFLGVWTPPEPEKIVVEKWCYFRSFYF